MGDVLYALRNALVYYLRQIPDENADEIGKQVVDIFHESQLYHAISREDIEHYPLYARFCSWLDMDKEEGGPARLIALSTYVVLIGKDTWNNYQQFSNFFFWKLHGIEPLSVVRLVEEFGSDWAHSVMDDLAVDKEVLAHWKSAVDPSIVRAISGWTDQASKQQLLDTLQELKVPFTNSFPLS